MVVVAQASVALVVIFAYPASFHVRRLQHLTQLLFIFNPAPPDDGAEVADEDPAALQDLEEDGGREVAAVFQQAPWGAPAASSGLTVDDSAMMDGESRIGLGPERPPDPGSAARPGGTSSSSSLGKAWLSLSSLRTRLSEDTST
jgi:hypothetical protein